MRNARRFLNFNLTVALVLAFAGLSLAGCQSKTPAQQLASNNQLVALALNSAADLRDAGLLPQADLDAAKPVVDAYFKAKAEAEREIRDAAAAQAAGLPYDASAVDNAVKQALAALEPLKPYLAKLDAAKAKQKPATRPAG